MKLIKQAFDNFKEMVKGDKVTIENRLEERIALHVEDKLLNLYSAISDCESPIEKILAIELDRVAERSFLNIHPHFLPWTPQKEITLFEGTNREVNYRIDFMFQYYNHETGVNYSFAIECDGHDFHDRTKEQASRDREKDRNLMLNGIPVIRFTGSDIYKNPYRCATEAIRIIENYIKNIYRAK